MDITTGTRPVVMAATSVGISRSGPFVTMTTRVPSGNVEASGFCSAFQNPAQVAQPEERKPRRVKPSWLFIAMARASPDGVTPATVCAETELRSGWLTSRALKGVASAWGRCVVRAGRVAHADAELVEGTEDVGVAPQEPCDQDTEHQHDERHNHDQSNHRASFCQLRSSIQRSEDLVKGILFRRWSQTVAGTAARVEQAAGAAADADAYP